MRRHAASFVFEALCGLCLLASGCATDDSGGGGGGDASDVERDRSEADGPSPDLGPQPDVGTGDSGLDVSDPRTDPVVTDVAAESDLVEPPCGALNQACCDGTCDEGLDCTLDGCVAQVVECLTEPACISPIGGEPDVPIFQRSGAPPVLAGGVIVDGDYELDLIELYTDATVSNLVDTFEVTSNGDTSGSLVFDGTDWGFEANLDLFIDASAVGQSFAQAVQQSLNAGGCYTAVGNELRGDLTQCGASWPEGTAPPDSLDYEVQDGGIQLLLILTRDMILAAVPEENQFLAGLAIVGDLPVLLTFTEIP